MKLRSSVSKSAVSAGVNVYLGARYSVTCAISSSMDLANCSWHSRVVRRSSCEVVSYAVFVTTNPNNNTIRNPLNLNFHHVCTDIAPFATWYKNKANDASCFLCFERQTLGTAPLPKRNINAHSVKDSALLSTISVPCVIALRSRLVCHLAQRFGGYAVNVIVPVIQFCVANEKRKMNGHISLFIFHLQCKMELTSYTI